ncbi:non-ribosomal peptide synthetase [Vibrio spartinae]|uniref:Chondramide synthase cmdD n=1 Tax=Vibrio spartinae TaxID=1918945 RepID=A0ABX6QYN4_9VIBR|nr:non-ribosomal peptide synthetase [Vibrio spartinae]QMV14117.1 Chondramide synthase cmdD [Vibrio spartinae]
MSHDPRTSEKGIAPSKTVTVATDAAKTATEMSDSKRQLMSCLLRGQGAHGSEIRHDPKISPVISFAQERLWFLEQLVPGSAINNIAGAVLIDGALDTVALRQAFKHILHRHLPLRSCFREVDGMPTVQLNDVDAMVWETHDFRQFDEETREAKAMAELSQWSGVPFDLTCGPLVRSCLYQLAERQFLFGVVIHHIACDGWSLNLLVQELAQFYRAETEGEEIPPPLTVNYYDYSSWQRGDAAQSGWSEQLAYWKQQFATLPPSPYPWPDSHDAIRSDAIGRRKTLFIPASLSQKLRQLGYEHQATPFMVLLTLYKILLHRVGGECDICVGTPVANRDRREIESLIGFFVNFLPLRTELSGELSFLQALARVRATSINGFNHQSLPFEVLIREVQPEWHAGWRQLVQVAFAYHQQHPTHQIASGNALRMQPREVDHGAAMFDLMLSVQEESDGLRVVLEYAVPFIHTATADMLLSAFQALLTDAVNAPETPIAAMSLQSPQAYERQLCRSRALRSFPVTDTIHQRFSAQVRRYPEAEAVRYGHESLNYKALERLSDHLARSLIARGVTPGARVGICLERSLEMVVAVLAVLKSGCAYVPLDPAYPKERLALLCELAEPALVVTRSGLCSLVPPCLLIDEEGVDEKDTDGPYGMTPSELQDLPQITPKDAAYVIFTSGSTGVPKGVVVNHENVLRLFEATQAQFHIDDEDVWSLFHSISFDFSVWELWGALLHGGCLVVVPQAAVKDPLALRQLLEREKVTVLSQTPSAFRGLIRAEMHQPSRLEHLRLVIFGGEALALPMLKDWMDRYVDSGPALVNMYGITETTVHVTARRIHAEDITRLQGSVIGRPLDDITLFLLDANGLMVPDGVPGEIWIGGTAVSQGYLNRPDLTAERFVVRDIAGFHDRFYRTGDLARYWPDGDLEYLGRIDQQIQNRGHRIEPGEIEAVFRRHPLVADCLVCERTAHNGNAWLVSYVIESGTDLRPDIAQETRLMKTVFDDIYAEGVEPSSPEVPNITGWNHTDTGQPIDREEMEEWIAWTLYRLRLLHPSHIVEIGSGLGLLALELAKQCRTYRGSDISGVAVRYLTHKFQALGLAHCHVEQQDAVDFITGIMTPVDLVILNSVIQYFPNKDYLTQVLRGAQRVVGKQGVIFIGDIRCLSLMPAFYTAVAISRTGRDAGIRQIARLVRQLEKEEREICIAPDFFHQFVPDGFVDVQWKRSRYQNEMTHFRYDVVLYSQLQPQLKIDKSLSWESLGRDPDRLHSLLKESPETLRVLSIPNGRFFQDKLLGDMLLGSESAIEGRVDTLIFQAAEQTREQGALDPEILWQMAQLTGYHICIAPSIEEGTAWMDVLFSLEPIEAGHPWQPEKLHTQDLGSEKSQSVNTFEQINDPLQQVYRRDRLENLRRYAAENLPTHMLPDLVMSVDAFPVTPNGKLDLESLPMPRNHSESQRSGASPSTFHERALTKIWTSLLGIESVGLDDDFWLCGGHSLLAARLMFRIEDEFQIRVPLMALFANSSLRGMAATIEAAQSQKPGQGAPTNPAFWYAEAEVDPDIVPPTTRSLQPTILLTGATGFFGCYLLFEALSCGRYQQVYCLVRAADDQQGYARIRHMLDSRGLWRTEFASVLQVWSGDLAQPDLGLSEQRLQLFADQVGEVLHNGCRVNFSEPYQQLKNANVVATETLLRLACRGDAKPFHYISSLGVFDDGDMGERFGLYEDREPSHPHTLDDAYSQTKWVAERMVTEVGKRGLPITVIRPSRIGSHSVSGDIRPDDLLWLVIRASLAIGALPALDLPLDVIPVDYAARVTLALMDNEQAFGKAFHLNHPNPSRYQEIQLWLASAGYPLVVENYAVWRSKMLEAAKQHADSAVIRLVPLLAHIAPDSLTEAKYAWADSTHTLQYTAGKIGPCPAFDGTLLLRSLRTLEQSGLISSHRGKE